MTGEAAVAGRSATSSAFSSPVVSSVKPNVPVSRLAEDHAELVIQTLTRQHAADIVGEFEAMFAWRSPVSCSQ